MAYINVSNFINNTFAVSTELGEKLFEEIKINLEMGEEVVLDFEGIQVLITAFLNASIGSLYNNYFDENIITTRLKFVNISEDDKQYLSLVVENAKKYYQNREFFDKNNLYGED